MPKGGALGYKGGALRAIRGHEFLGPEVSVRLLDSVISDSGEKEQGFFQKIEPITLAPCVCYT